MTKDEALKLALEALENSIDAVRHEYETDWRHGYPTREAQLASMKMGVEAHEQAITAIKEALAQPEAAAVIGIPTTGEYAMGYAEGFNDACKKPEQEPEPDAKLYITPPKQEPRNFCPRCGKRTADLTVIHTCTPPEGGHQ